MTKTVDVSAVVDDRHPDPLVLYGDVVDEPRDPIVVHAVLLDQPRDPLVPDATQLDGGQAVVPFEAGDDRAVVVTEGAADDPHSEARLAEIEQIYDHQQMPLLEKLELAKEYIEIAEQQISRQDVAKTPGRPEGGISLAARKLAVPGRTHAGRKKWLERALKIASLSPAVKAEAQKKGVARFQSRLLEVAEVEGEAAQLQKVQEIANGRGKKPAAEEGFLRAVVHYPADRKDEFLRKLAELVDEFEAKLDL